MLLQKDYCCGFLWRTGCIIYICIDIVSSILGFAIFALIVGSFDSPQDSNDPYINSDMNSLDSEIVLVHKKLIYDRIVAGCGIKATNVDPNFILQKLVICVILWSLGTVGFLFTAILLILAVIKKGTRWMCNTVIGLQACFLTSIILGGIYFNAASLCPINYNIEHLPRQKLSDLMIIVVVLYKFHEMYTVYRFMKDEDGKIQGPLTHVLSLEAFQSRRKSYAFYENMPRKSVIYLTSDPTLSQVTSADDDDDDPSYNSLPNPETTNSHTKLDVLNFVGELDQIEESASFPAQSRGTKKNTIGRIFQDNDDSVTGPSLIRKSIRNDESNGSHIPLSISNRVDTSTVDTEQDFTQLNPQNDLNEPPRKRRSRKSKISKSRKVRLPSISTTPQEVSRKSLSKKKHKRHKTKSSTPNISLT